MFLPLRALDYIGISWKQRMGGHQRTIRTLLYSLDFNQTHLIPGSFYSLDLFHCLLHNAVVSVITLLTDFHLAVPSGRI